MYLALVEVEDSLRRNDKKGVRSFSCDVNRTKVLKPPLDIVAENVTVDAETRKKIKHKVSKTMEEGLPLAYAMRKTNP